MRSKKFLFVSLFLLFLFCLTISSIGFTKADGTDPPQKIRITSESSFNSSVTITWQTNDSSSENEIVYDNVTHSSPTDYLHSKTGVDFTYDGASGHIHMATIDTLDPDTTYYFRCGGDVGGWSEERMFKTAPTSESDFVFVVGGDSQRVGNQMAVTSQAMAQFNASFIVHVGDMVDDGNDQSQWNKWFDDVNDNWVGLNGYTIPIIPTLGNHEANSTKYYMQFALPNNEQWYYYDWGNVRIIVLNCEATSSQIQIDQKEWLEDVLNSTDSSMWKMVFFHRNAYYSGGHENATDLQTHWVPVFDHYNVNIVFQGHNHHYHRTKPLRNNEIASPNTNGTIYITASGWDANLRDVIPQRYTAHANKTYNFVLMNASNDFLYLEAKDSSGSTFDYLWLYKNGTMVGDDIEYDIGNDGGENDGGNDGGNNGGGGGGNDDTPSDQESEEEESTIEMISEIPWWFRFWEWIINFVNSLFK